MGDFLDQDQSGRGDFIGKFQLKIIFFIIIERPVSMKFPVSGQTVLAGGVETTVRSPAQQPHDWSLTEVTSRLQSNWDYPVTIILTSL